jgi:hypothetical protein
MLDHVSIATDCSSSESLELPFCINDLADQNLSLYHYHLDTWSFLHKSRGECLAMGLGTYDPSWQTFNLEFDRFAVNCFRGILWTMDLDPRVGPQVFGRIRPSASIDIANSIITGLASKKTERTSRGRSIPHML